MTPDKPGQQRKIDDVAYPTTEGVHFQQKVYLRGADVSKASTKTPALRSPAPWTVGAFAAAPLSPFWHADSYRKLVPSTTLSVCPYSHQKRPYRRARPRITPAKHYDGVCKSDTSKSGSINIRLPIQASGSMQNTLPSQLYPSRVGAPPPLPCMKDLRRSKQLSEIERVAVSPKSSCQIASKCRSERGRSCGLIATVH